MAVFLFSQLLGLSTACRVAHWKHPTEQDKIRVIKDWSRALEVLYANPDLAPPEAQSWKKRLDVLAPPLIDIPEVARAYLHILEQYGDTARELSLIENHRPLHEGIYGENLAREILRQPDSQRTARVAAKVLRTDRHTPCRPPWAPLLGLAIAEDRKNGDLQEAERLTRVAESCASQVSHSDAQLLPPAQRETLEPTLVYLRGQTEPLEVKAPQGWYCFYPGRCSRRHPEDNGRIEQIDLPGSWLLPLSHPAHTAYVNLPPGAYMFHRGQARHSFALGQVIRVLDYAGILNQRLGYGEVLVVDDKGLVVGQIDPRFTQAEPISASTIFENTVQALAEGSFDRAIAYSEQAPGGSPALDDLRVQIFFGAGKALPEDLQKRVSTPFHYELAADAEHLAAQAPALNFAIGTAVNARKLPAAGAPVEVTFPIGSALWVNEIVDGWAHVLLDQQCDKIALTFAAAKGPTLLPSMMPVCAHRHFAWVKADFLAAVPPSPSDLRGRAKGAEDAHDFAAALTLYARAFMVGDDTAVEQAARVAVVAKRYDVAAFFAASTAAQRRAPAVPETALATVASFGCVGDPFNAELSSADTPDAVVKTPTPRPTCFVGVQACAPEQCVDAGFLRGRARDRETAKQQRRADQAKLVFDETLQRATSTLGPPLLRMTLDTTRIPAGFVGVKSEVIDGDGQIRAPAIHLFIPPMHVKAPLRLILELPKEQRRLPPFKISIDASSETTEPSPARGCECVGATC